jgi:small GTP-binding protein
MRAVALGGDELRRRAIGEQDFAALRADPALADRRRSGLAASPAYRAAAGPCRLVRIAARVGAHLRFPTRGVPRMPQPADRIRNVALVGHRGSGKTALHEALLFQAGAIDRLGKVTDGTTASDTEPDERARQMSISSTLSTFTWRERKINLLDTPGEPSFIADALSALRVCEAAIFVVDAVMGVEPSTLRLWERAAELDLARLVFVTMLDRERADLFRTLDALKAAFGPHVVATEIPIGAEQDVSGVVDLIDMQAYAYDGAGGREGGREIPIPTTSPSSRWSTARSSWTRSARSPSRSWSATSTARRSPTTRSSRRSRRARTTAACSR